MPCLLALSTSGPTASAALLRDGALLALQKGGAGAHSQTILPAVDALLTQAGLTPAELDLIAADTGPGSFTGVRIGVSIANAMGAALHKPILGISSLEALAYGRAGRVCSLLDARNGNCYAAVYENGLCLLPPCSLPIEELLAKLESPISFVGDGGEAFYELIAQRVCKYEVDAAAQVCADALALAAWQHFLKDECAQEILPLYLRPSQAERMYKEKQ